MKKFDTSIVYDDISRFLKIKINFNDPQIREKIKKELKNLGFTEVDVFDGGNVSCVSPISEYDHSNGVLYNKSRTLGTIIFVRKDHILLSTTHCLDEITELLISLTPQNIRLEKINKIID